MTDHPYIADHLLMADRDRLREENIRLEAENKALRDGLVVARGIEALQSFEGKPCELGEWPGCVQ